ncbi:hypothetical protein L486_05112 [Kwoniella mangroviensis CBS 10435]|uniref:Uncharacterized protein n=1 Tax=Kwoniella mangroviensis CBS 10435 TaxID=1331196 RepID=A0A1B9IQE3_9TREE|nr:hypothetical protein L486_05112 [Kwoniella mangroviensis CBS 10435]
MDEPDSDHDLLESYPTLSSPLKYFILLVGFMVIPVGLGVYFYGGGKERLAKLKSKKNKGYEKVESERV